MSRTSLCFRRRFWRRRTDDYAILNPYFRQKAELSSLAITAPRRFLFSGLYAVSAAPGKLVAHFVLGVAARDLDPAGRVVAD
ncbi:MAG: hypothetical protein IJV00_01100, partial [Clostridia bacterium]|nr:hypothetical protein [Clostridia bacterium]